MDYIDLESVGSTVQSDGLVFPTDISEPPVTASDADEMMGVSIFEVCDEWIENLSREDLISLVSFLDEHIGYRVGVGIYDGYEDWRTNTWSHSEDVNNCYMELELRDIKCGVA